MKIKDFFTKEIDTMIKQFEKQENDYRSGVFGGLCNFKERFLAKLDETKYDWCSDCQNDNVFDESKMPKEATPIYCTCGSGKLTGWR